MTEKRSENCIVCAVEFDPSELRSVALSKINLTRFKVCSSCIDHSDPADDYKQVKEIVNSYLTFASRHYFEEANTILVSNKK